MSDKFTESPSGNIVTIFPKTKFEFLERKGEVWHWALRVLQAHKKGGKYKSHMCGADVRDQVIMAYEGTLIEGIDHHIGLMNLAYKIVEYFEKQFDEVEEINQRVEQMQDTYNQQTQAI